MANPEPLRYDSIPPVLYDGGARYDSFAPANPERNTMAKIALGLGKLSREQNLQLGKSIKTGMTGNPNVPSPNPTLVALGMLMGLAKSEPDARRALRRRSTAQSLRRR